jgi:hypothetical protein
VGIVAAALLSSDVDSSCRIAVSRCSTGRMSGIDELSSRYLKNIGATISLIGRTKPHMNPSVRCDAITFLASDGAKQAETGIGKCASCDQQPVFRAEMLSTLVSVCCLPQTYRT